MIKVNVKTCNYDRNGYNEEPKTQQTKSEVYLLNAWPDSTSTEEESFLTARS